MTMNQGLAVTGDFEILAGPGRAGASRPYFPLAARPVGPVKSVPSWVRTKSKGDRDAVPRQWPPLPYLRSCSSTAHDGVRAARIASSRAVLVLCRKR